MLKTISILPLAKVYLCINLPASDNFRVMRNWPPYRFVLFAAPLLLSGCYHYYYSPNQHNVPLFKDKNEARVSGAYISGDQVKGCDIQAAYSVSKQVAVIANAFIVNPRAQLQNNTPGESAGNIGSGKGQLYELGAGYFKPIPCRDNRLSKKIVFETYGVMGLGNSQGLYGNYPGYSVNTRLFKGYLQPSIGSTTNLFDLIFSAKIGVLHTFGIQNSYTAQAYDTLMAHGSSIGNDLAILHRDRTAFLFEPAFMIRAGFKYVKLHFEVGGSFLGNDMRSLTSSPVWDLGLTVFIGRRFWQKDERPKNERWKEIVD
jgi:hypothetical protein